MKVDLWKCDRCPVSKECAPAMGQPSGWLILAPSEQAGTDKSKGKEVHLCEKCRVAFHQWLTG